ncbi:MAG: ribosomal protein L13e [Nitrososphaera sp.]
MQATVKEGSRAGRGFSIAELKEAGLDAHAARKRGVPVDVWRDTKYDENVEQLKTIARSVKESRKEEKKKSEPSPKPKTAKKPAKKKTTRKKQKERKK